MSKKRGPSLGERGAQLGVIERCKPKDRTPKKLAKDQKW